VNTVDIRTCTAGAGLQSVRAGLRLLGRAPLMLPVLVGLGPMLAWSVAMVPVAGPALGLVLWPMLLLGMLRICRTVEAAQVPGITDYLAALRDPPARQGLLRIGVAYALVLGVLATLWSLAPVPPPPAPPTDLPRMDLSPGQVVLALCTLGVWIPVEMALWLAPALVAWHAMAPGKALFFSLVACWRNRGALALRLLCALGLFTLILLALLSLIDVLGISENAARYLLLPVPLLMFAILQGSKLALYHQVVQERPAAGNAAAPPADAA